MKKIKDFYLMLVATIVLMVFTVGFTSNPKENNRDIAGINAIILEMDKENETMLVEGIDQNSPIGDKCFVNWSNADLQEVDTEGNLEFISIDKFNVGDYIVLFTGGIKESYPTRTSANIIQLQNEVLQEQPIETDNSPDIDNITLIDRVISLLQKLIDLSGVNVLQNSIGENN
ncbi:MAG: hypothetical protein ACRCW1_05950 [Anaerotignaceae bacterium]